MRVVLFLASLLLAALLACDGSLEIPTSDGGSGAKTGDGGSSEVTCPQIPGCTFVNAGYGCNGGCIGSSGSGGAPTPTPVACGTGTCTAQTGPTCCEVPAGSDGGGDAGTRYYCAFVPDSCPSGATTILSCHSAANCHSGQVCCVSGTAGDGGTGAPVVTNYLCEMTMCPGTSTQVCAGSAECTRGQLCRLPVGPPSDGGGAPATGICVDASDAGRMDEGGGG